MGTGPGFKVVVDYLGHFGTVAEVRGERRADDAVDVGYVDVFDTLAKDLEADEACGACEDDLHVWLYLQVCSGFSCSLLQSQRCYINRRYGGVSRGDVGRQGFMQQGLHKCFMSTKVDSPTHD